ncbi:unnamed protein product [Trichobilharzia regenti]|nr:unnamed protein product [Trichobilharzia regenti]
MGLTPIPLSCLINAMLYQTIRNPSTLCLSLPFVISVLFAVKVVTNLTLMSMAYSHVREYINTASASQTEENYSSSNDNKTAKPVGGDIHTTTSSVKNTRQDQQTHETEAKERKLSLRKPPFNYNGYDQPTRDEEYFLPMGLRHRRIRSDSGPVDVMANVDAVHSYTSENSSEYVGSKVVMSSPISTGLIANELVEPYYSIMASSNGTPKSLYDFNELAPLTPIMPMDSVHRLLTPGNMKSEVECDRNSYESALFQTEDKSLFAAYINPPTTTPPHLDRHRMHSRYDLSNVVSTRVTTNEIPSNKDNPQQDESRVAYLPDPTRKRRVRTMTEGSASATSPPVDPTIPILWERSSRNSTVNQFGLDQLKPTTSGRVKQPLSDIDRYSMVEGQIS